jgi:hypothetical protein
VPGLASPDVPAVYSYLIVIVVGAVVARNTVSDRLTTNPDHWAFLSTWLLFIAYALIPPLLLWLLDYTGAVHDTSLFTALIIGFGYRQVFAGNVQGVNVPAPATGFWKPFQAWVDAVAERLADRQKRYRDLFAEQLRQKMLDDPNHLQRLAILAQQRSANLPQLSAAIQAVQALGLDPVVTNSRLFDVLWPDLRGSASNTYGLLLYQAGLVGRFSRWWYLERGRAKLVTGATLLALLLVMVAAWFWMSSDPRATTIWQGALQRYYQWRLLKGESTERDRWRAREYFAGELSAVSAPPATPGAVGHPATDAAHVTALIRPLIRQLTYPEISARQLDEILRLFVNHHGIPLDTHTIPELIESLRTTNEVARLNIHRTLLALQKVDYPKAPAPDKALVGWEPKKDESAADIDHFVRLWNGWWRTAQK